MSMPLIKRVPSFDLDISKPLCASEQITAFERRLIRLWQLRKRPSEIALCLEISVSMLSDELDRLADKLDLLYPLFDSKERQGSYRSSDEKRIILNDLEWLYSCHLFKSEIEKSEFLSVEPHSLTHFVRVSDLDLGTKRQDRSSERNARIIEDYRSMKKSETKGIISKLAKKYSISRKMVDLILGDVKEVRRKKQPKTDPIIVERRASVFREWNEKICNSPSKRSLAVELAKKYGYTSESSIYKIVKELS